MCIFIIVTGDGEIVKQVNIHLVFISALSQVIVASHLIMLVSQ